MQATSTKGIWNEEYEFVTILFDTTRNPERISIQFEGKSPIHFEYPDGIGENDILIARKRATEN